MSAVNVIATTWMNCDSNRRNPSSMITAPGGGRGEESGLEESGLRKCGGDQGKRSGCGKERREE